MSVGGLWKQEGASGKLLAFFCPLIVLGFKYRIGLVGRGGGRRREGRRKHGIFL